VARDKSQEKNNEIRMTKPRKYTMIVRVLCRLYAAKLEGMTNSTLAHPERSEAESRNPAALPTGITTGFDSLTFRSLSLGPSRLCRGFPSRSILDFARNDGPVSSSFELWASFVVRHSCFVVFC
jgi:hypothetical protein